MARSPRRRKTRRLSSPRCADDERCPPKDQTLAVARPPGEGMRLYGHPTDGTHAANGEQASPLCQ
jgi:hypothetical protein